MTHVSNPDKPKKQIEIIVSGTLESFKGLVEFEQKRAGGSNSDYDNTIVSLVTMAFGLYGPITQGSGRAVYWLVVNGYHHFLDAHRRGRSGVSMGGPSGQLKLQAGITLDELDREARRQGISLSRILHVGEMWASELPGEQIRVVFNVSLFGDPHLFWKWVGDFVAEMNRQGFKQPIRTVAPRTDSNGLKNQALSDFWGEVAVKYNLSSVHQEIAQWLVEQTRAGAFPESFTVIWVESEPGYFIRPFKSFDSIKYPSITKARLEILASEGLLHITGTGVSQVDLLPALYTAVDNGFQKPATGMADNNIDTTKEMANTNVIRFNASLFRHLLEESFSLDELKSLCLDMGVEYENIPGEITREAKAREIINYAQRHGFLLRLISKLQELRPKVNWLQIEAH